LWVEQLKQSDHALWEQFVRRHSRATFAHLPGISEAFEKAYGLKTVTLAAFCSRSAGNNEAPGTSEQRRTLVGLLPMVHIKPLLWGNEWVSMPFLDTGGVLAEDCETAEELVRQALRIAALERVRKLEFRQPGNGSCQTAEAVAHRPAQENADVVEGYRKNVLRRKVRLVLELPDSPDTLMQSFKSKLRSQIQKPMRDGLTVAAGGLELLDHFYEILCLNMKELGSPVHSKEFFQSILRALPETTHIFVAYQKSTPLAAGLAIGFGDCLYNPWASSIKTYRKLNPNMLLYWHMLEFGCRRNFKFFDFGRSTPQEGTYKFKVQWGAVPQPLEWSVYTLGTSFSSEPREEKSRYATAIYCWKKLPVGLTKWLGPKIRKHISL